MSAVNSDAQKIFDYEKKNVTLTMSAKGIMALLE